MADMRHQEGGQGRGDRHAMRKSCSDVDLLMRLTSQRDKENGSTPLHLAASMGGFPSVNLVPIWFSRVRVLSATRLLLNANVSTAYLPDHNQGMYPIHVAASAGCLESVKALLERCPDCATLRDAKGRTFLHSAAEKTRFCVNSSIRVRELLLNLRAPYGERRGDLFDEKHTSVIVKFKGGEEKMSENVTDAAQVLAIFSVLITTVTFASAFTLPGGYRSAGAAGTPVLAGSYAFDAFVLSDALAFLFSFSATSVLLYAGVPAYTLETRFRTINCAYGLMMNSGRCLVAALALGLYVVLLPPVGRTIAIAIAVGMVMLALVLTKDSEGSLIPTVARSRKPSLGVVSACIIYVLERYWSFILIFGLPAIRKWARAK
ncbi:hypothetical protein E2562_012245 [Oryza meyeriana var. granulata]|uniref:PGG domain-containing protein n=1 Tax=Oryza meyeriana var. granulata TaxID=110450 RepID=A0A6G1D2Q5_9ORYZ|nr:hypothetical protein E2562_012245 [Oryza meyeriana var. granulata]